MTFSPRSMLFVSAEKPTRFSKALASGADMICIDLEDAVHPDNKDQARQDVVRYLSDRQPVPGVGLGSVAIGIRINPVETTQGLADIHALVSAACRFDVIVLPKVTSPREVALCQSWFSGCLRAKWLTSRCSNMPGAWWHSPPPHKNNLPRRQQ